MALQETVNSCDHFRTEIHFLNRRLSCLFRPEALGYVYISIYIYIYIYIYICIYIYIYIYILGILLYALSTGGIYLTVLR